MRRVPEVLEHALDLRGQVFHAGRRENFHVRLRRRNLDLDFLVVEFAFAQSLAKFLARRVIAFAGRGHAVARGRQQHIEDALLGLVLGLMPHFARRLLARLLDRGFDQVADDGIDVAPDVADFGELGRLDLDERRIGEPRQPPRDFGLADAGRPDHQDVFRRDLLAQRLGHLLPAPAVAQRNRDGALGGVLPDDVLVQLVDDFLRGHLGHKTAFSVQPSAFSHSGSS